MITTSCTTSSVQRRTVLRVRAGAGEWRGPWQRRRESFRILARSAEGRGRSTGPVARPDSTLLSVYHSWTIVSVTAVTFTARSVHSRAIDPDTLHFQGSPRLEQGQWRSASCQLWLARLPLPRLPDTVAERLGFAQTSFVPCWRVRCHAFLRFSTFIVFVGAIAVVAVGAAEPSVVVDGTALVFRLPRFLYGRGDA